MIIWVDWPAGANRGAPRYCLSSWLERATPSRICRMGDRMASLFLSGASRARLCSEGSSMLTESRSASRPSRQVSSGSAPGMALAWMYPAKP